MCIIIVPTQDCYPVILRQVFCKDRRFLFHPWSEPDQSVIKATLVYDGTPKSNLDLPIICSIRVHHIGCPAGNCYNNGKVRVFRFEGIPCRYSRCHIASRIDNNWLNWRVRMILLYHLKSPFIFFTNIWYKSTLHYQNSYGYFSIVFRWGTGDWVIICRIVRGVECWCGWTQSDTEYTKKGESIPLTIHISHVYVNKS